MNWLDHFLGAAFAAWMSSAAAYETPPEPSSIEQVRPGKTGFTVLVTPKGVSSQEEDLLLASKPWIARTLHVLANPGISPEGLKRLLNWKDTKPPRPMPGVVPGVATSVANSYVVMRQANWRVVSPQEVGIDIVWVHSNNRDAPYFIETQLYREDQGVWYLHRQSRKRIETCHKYPYCVEDIK